MSVNKKYCAIHTLKSVNFPNKSSYFRTYTEMFAHYPYLRKRDQKRVLTIVYEDYRKTESGSFKLANVNK